MGCCGKNRTVARVTENHETARATFTPQAVKSSEYFQYVGMTDLIAVGAITGRRYRFTSPGAILEVDGSDAPAMNAVPNLRRAKL